MENNHRLKYLFVINNGSGSTDNNAIVKEIENFLPAEDHTSSIYILPESFKINQIKDHVIKLNPQTLVAVGGDGTVTMMANIAAEANLLLGIIPAGSANGMAKELGIGENTTEALDIVKHGVQKNIDLIAINDSERCLHLSDIGLNALLVKHFDEGNKRGKFGYAMVLLKTLWQKQKMKVEIHTDETVLQRDAFMVALANARMYGTGAVINPGGKLDDGLFEVIIIRKLSFSSLVKMLFIPGNFNPTHIETISCKKAEIHTNRFMHFQIDGEYKGRTKYVKAEINKGVVKVLLPLTQNEKGS